MTLEDSIFKNVQNENIRIEKGLYSVYDVIKTVARKKAPRTTWSRLIDRFGYLANEVHSVRFPRIDGKAANISSPACNIPTALDILGRLGLEDKK
jgi:hypothetical protein